MIFDPVVRVRAAGYLFITPILHERSFTPVAGRTEADRGICLTPMIHERSFTSVAGSTENLSAGVFSFEKSVIVVMGKKVEEGIMCYESGKSEDLQKKVYSE
jgi:hypothetical protein